ncbi:MAG: hypothetical protein K2R98_10295 [Gemmataceae bacterium]|nr:hypothetical protein [Gemmataceae bacterium]
MNALTVGQRVTLLKIDDMMAMSHRHDLEILALSIRDVEPRVGRHRLGAIPDAHSFAQAGEGRIGW